MVVVEHVPSDIDRIILVSTSRRHSRVIELPSFNSEGRDVTIEILPAKPGDGLHTNTAIDEDGPSLEHVRDMILNREMPEVHRDDESGDVPSTEEIRKQILGR